MTHITIPARKGKAAFVAKGQIIRVINTHGQQVVDTWAFNRADLSEFMSMEHSRAGLLKIIPAPGDTMLSNHRRPIVTFVEDNSGGIHDTLMAAPAHTVIRNGRLLDIAGHTAPPADLLIAGDTIAAIGPPGLAAPDDAVAIEAGDRLLMPGLVNAHTHGHGNLAKGMGDVWTLELLLNAGPYLNGHRSLEDKYLSGLLGGLDMIRSGTTACYDLMHEFPLPTAEGLAAVARGYNEAGVRVVLPPLVADHSFFEAIPGLMDALPPSLARAVERFRLAPAETALAALRGIVPGRTRHRPLPTLCLPPTIPLHCSDGFITGCGALAREYGTALQMHLAESRIQAVSGMRRYGKTLTAP